MHNIWTLAKKEFDSFFHSPIAYIVGVVIFLTLGIFYWLQITFAIQSQAYIPEMSGILDLLLFPLFFLSIPVLTMRSISDENKTGTLELLMTTPLRDWELIIGKWLGTFLFFLSILALTWIYPLVLNLMVEPGIDQVLLIANYIGIVLFTGALTAIGILISTLFKNQIAALFATLGTMIILWIIASPAQFSSGFSADLLNYLSITNHYYESFRIGIVDLKDVIYYLSITALSLFMGSRVIDAKRWRS